MSDFDTPTGDDMTAYILRTYRALIPARSFFDSEEFLQALKDHFMRNKQPVTPMLEAILRHVQETPGIWKRDKEGEPVFVCLDEHNQLKTVSADQ